LLIRAKKKLQDCPQLPMTNKETVPTAETAMIVFLAQRYPQRFVRISMRPGAAQDMNIMD